MHFREISLFSTVHLAHLKLNIFMKYQKWTAHLSWLISRLKLAPENAPHHASAG